jgi:hypothetical protein
MSDNLGEIRIRDRWLSIEAIERLIDANDALRAENEAHRAAQARIFQALGPNADPDRDTWPAQIEALRASQSVLVEYVEAHEAWIAIDSDEEADCDREDAAYIRMIDSQASYRKLKVAETLSPAPTTKENTP